MLDSMVVSSNVASTERDLRDPLDYLSVAVKGYRETRRYGRPSGPKLKPRKMPEAEDSR